METQPVTKTPLPASPQSQVRSTGERQTIRNNEPATGKPLPEVPVMTPSQVQDAIRRARAAQPAWAALPFSERRRKLIAFKNQILDHAEEVCDLLSRENGKPRIEALMHEVVPSADLTAFFARRAKRVLRDEKIRLRLFPNKASYVKYVPRGVVGSITAWNFPFVFFVSDVVTALASGNAVVVKPSEFTSLISLKGKELCDRAGIPSDLVQVVTGFGPTGAALYDSNDPALRADIVVFTGSVPTGRRIAAACGERLIPCVLELGGSAPAIVRADVDIERTAKSVVYGAFANSGQICVSVNRVFVDERISKHFTDRVVAITKTLRQGSDGEVDVGAVTTPAQLEIVKRQVEDALTKGAKAETGGQQPPGPGRFFPPTVLSGVTLDMAVMREETFGPLMPIFPFKSEDEAIRMANDTPFGLMGYVFSKDKRRAREIAERIQAGTVIVNDVLYTYGAPETPWGGVKQSGIGRVHSEHSLKDLCEMRHVNTQRFHLSMPWMYPYRGSAEKMVLNLARKVGRLFS
jgi:acyl-CoA reductase-like NAD-dependent aldehyde dehydrogenase